MFFSDSLFSSCRLISVLFIFLPFVFVCLSLTLHVFLCLSYLSISICLCRSYFLSRHLPLQYFHPKAFVSSLCIRLFSLSLPLVACFCLLLSLYILLHLSLSPFCSLFLIDPLQCVGNCPSVPLFFSPLCIDFLFFLYNICTLLQFIRKSWENYFKNKITSPISIVYYCIVIVNILQL